MVHEPALIVTCKFNDSGVWDDAVTCAAVRGTYVVRSLLKALRRTLRGGETWREGPKLFPLSPRAVPPTPGGGEKAAFSLRRGRQGPRRTFFSAVV